ncbi:hypothetical protein NG895_09575 [Aeoliella sp. ICT_H6.2]|uniref:Uncharacterized protein n=1 Tax=Aeoliella straminimaris TaxID=2954799 RepID=A0A9X2JFX8_9BACT|nr:hypothetical protein [Aeoliella straminimaris]MCO6044156.1 hypothetical protein [Aeoliella straminimaris]
MGTNSQDNASNSWKQLVYYGEVVGFVLAWVVGGVLLARSSMSDPSLAGTRGLDSYAEVGLTELPSKDLK